MGIANILTLLRIGVGPLFILIYLFHDTLGVSFQVLPYILFGLFAFAECSDAVDGFLARKYQQVTDFGKVIDPLADSISHLAFFMAFTAGPVQLPVYLVFFFFYREALINGLRTLCALRGFALAAKNSGKFKTIFQGIAVGVIIAAMVPYSYGYISQETLTLTATSLTVVALVFTIYSAYDHVKTNVGHIKALLFTV